MINNSNKHLKTHTVSSAEDTAAVVTLEFFFRSDGRINTNFFKNDKWPNIDGNFEFVSNPDVSRQPLKNFFVQIKGTNNYSENDGIIKYYLKDLAFLDYICSDVTLDPGILFVVLCPAKRGQERIFWKYISIDFLNSVDLNKKSVTISFSLDEEIFNTEESINGFCKKLEKIVNHHSFVNRLSSKSFSRSEIDRIINVCDKQIVENIDMIDTINLTREDVAQRILPRLYDLCQSALLLNSLKLGSKNPNLQLAWEQAMLSVDTKYLARFLKGLKYLDHRIPEEGQSERLILKYYNFLWQIRRFLKKEYGIYILSNLEKIPLEKDELDSKYYEAVANAISSTNISCQKLSNSRFYITKKKPFFVENEIYYEITLQLADIYATKYNRITAYTKENLLTNYSIQIGYVETDINLWEIKSEIKIITNWKVSIAPTCLNKLGKILNIKIKLSAQYKEYSALMEFLTRTGLNFLELIDFQELPFSKIVDSIYEKTSTSYFKNVLNKLNLYYSKSSSKFGRNTVRYLLLKLKEEHLINVMPRTSFQKTLVEDLYLSSACYPFEKNPFISNLPHTATTLEQNIKFIIDVTGEDDLRIVKPYLNIKKKIQQTGEIFFELKSIGSKEEIKAYNDKLDAWEIKKGYQINIENDIVSIDSYEKNTISILKNLIKFSQTGNKGQKEFNLSFLKNNSINFEDEMKKRALSDVFVDSHLILIYGAAGTGKTTLINYISNLMAGKRKLFLTKTHTAKQNLKRRIDNPGADADFISIDSFAHKVSLPDYDIIFVDECSTIDNRIMCEFFKKINPETFLVLAGDVHQIGSIDFGNWFFYAKDIINKKGANVELLNTWRTQEQSLISLWDEVRKKESLITEKLAIDGPFSDNIGENIFKKEENDEIILCLNYDGKFGLNNMNRYFQNSNNNKKAVYWQEWKYKVGDLILFNESQRFSILYNNLKGKIVDIDKSNEKITFTIDVATNLTESDCSKEGLEFIAAKEGTTTIRFAVFAYDNIIDEEKEELRMLSVIPFQLAYAVSIHKAQGLEYDSVKVIIPKSSSEKITHGIFYTAITRAKKKLKIYWSSEVMNEVINGFIEEEPSRRSFDIIYHKLFSTN